MCGQHIQDLLGAAVDHRVDGCNAAGALINHLAVIEFVVEFPLEIALQSGYLLFELDDLLHFLFELEAGLLSVGIARIEGTQLGLDAFEIVIMGFLASLEVLVCFYTGIFHMRCP